jgi:lysophospholipid acyltransferase (LPLAT)-like uncharacterized protein
MRLVKPIIKKVKRSRVFSFFFKNLLYWSLRLLFLTYRLEVVYATDDKKKLLDMHGVFYFWHQQIISGMYFFFKHHARGACVVSPSHDGMVAGYICQKLGFDVLYGSSHKSSVRLVRNALQELQRTGRLCLVGDGSRGPAFQLQPGISYLADKVGIPLVFIDCAPGWTYTFTKSWDQFKLPLPFSKIVVTVRYVCPSSSS